MEPGESGIGGVERGGAGGRMRVAQGRGKGVAGAGGRGAG